MRHEKGLIEAMWNVSLEKMYIVPHLVYKWDKLHFSRAVTADVCQTFYAVNVIKELGLCGIYWKQGHFDVYSRKYSRPRYLANAPQDSSGSA